MELNESYAVRCPTLEDANELISFLYEHTDIRWHDEPEYIRSEWDKCGSETMYFIDKFGDGVHCITMAGDKENILQKDIVIDSVAEFLTLFERPPEIDTSGICDLL